MKWDWCDEYSTGVDNYHGQMDSFVCDLTAEDMYAYDYAMHDTWQDVEREWAEELGVELEVYED